jgi:signal transduction histidine kinase
LISAIRWLLATTALTIIYLDPKEPDNKVWGFTYVVLAGYVLYSSVLYFLAIRRVLISSRFELWAHWIDVAWFTLLIGLSTGTNRIFFFGFLFAILVASFRRGFKAGLSVVFVSTLSVTIVGYTAETASYGFEGYGFDVYRFMLRPVFMIVLGYLMAHWGESEIQSKRRLALLKDITLSNPRLGVDRTISAIMEALRKFYAANLVLLVLSDNEPGHYIVYRAEGDTSGATRREEISGGLGDELSKMPQSLSICYDCGFHFFRRAKLRLQTFGDDGGAEIDRELGEKLASAFDARSYISVPVFRHYEATGRLYVSRNDRPSFNRSDVDFLLNVMKHANPIIENIRLVDTLASDAAQRERHRIARDIHDSIIQPYIGFQIAIAGLRRKVDAGQSNLSSEIQQLTEMTAVGVTDLRSYVNKLKNPSEPESAFLPAVERFVSKFSDATGIKVIINAPANLIIDGSLAAEVFQLIAEGLSNIRKHTDADKAVIQIRNEGKRLFLRIENDCAETPPPFTPRSITERAGSLSGVATIERSSNLTAVQVEIPL